MELMGRPHRAWRIDMNMQSAFVVSEWLVDSAGCLVGTVNE
jgi:hypothetical protein